jgi:predicted nucleic acid-binding protein
MRETIISDTSCLLAFYDIGEMPLLHKMYGEIVTTSTVQREFGHPLPPWIVVREPSEEFVRSVRMQFTLDPGEITAIALALSIPESTLIIDEVAGRRAASQLGIRMTGTLGILLKAKKQGVISSIRPLIQKLRSVKFWMSESLIREILIEADEN